MGMMLESASSPSARTLKEFSRVMAKKFSAIA
jgi:hypothetical protein